MFYYSYTSWIKNTIHVCFLASVSLSNTLKSFQYFQQSSVVEIADMEALVMRHFLHFLYTGELGAALDVQLAKDLFIAADKYQVQQLKTFCEAFMSKNLTPENVSYVMVLAHLHACVGRWS